MTFRQRIINERDVHIGTGEMHIGFKALRLCRKNELEGQFCGTATSTPSIVDKQRHVELREIREFGIECNDTFLSLGREELVRDEGFCRRSSI